MPALARASMDARVRLVLPPPDGADTTNRPPGTLFDILHLLAELLDDDLDVDGVARGLGVLRLRRQGVGLAVELLHQEIEPPADGILARQRLAHFGEVRAEARELLVDVEPLRG